MMKGPISKVDTSSRFNALAEIPMVSIITSAGRLPYSFMSLVFNILKYPVSANKPDCLKNMKIALIGVGRSLVEWIPFLGNYIAIHLNVKEKYYSYTLDELKSVSFSAHFRIEKLPYISRKIIERMIKTKENTIIKNIISDTNKTDLLKAVAIGEMITGTN
jgi:hypothetical protein